MTEKNEGFFFKNCFDPIRYWAALSVMLLHYTGFALKISDNGLEPINILRNIATIFPGVVILFSMSGYLISASFERSNSRKEFLVKRVLRMYPELWVCTLVNLLVVVLLAGKMINRTIWIWVGTQIFGIANTPSCLSNFATGSINGSLWTIFVEVQFYILVGFLYPKLKKLTNKKWIFVLAMLVFVNILCECVSEKFGVISKLMERTFIPYAIWFFIGVFCYIRKDVLLPWLKKYCIALLGGYLVIRFLPIKIPGYYANIFVGVLCPLIVIGAAYKLPSIRIKCDITYGMFLYHWIVLNVIIHFNLMNKLPWFVTLLLFMISTFILAWVSWKYVGHVSKLLSNKLLERIG